MGDEREYYEEFGLLVKDGTPWEIAEAYHFNHKSMGDCIFNNGQEAKKRKTTAHLTTCRQTLKARKRWPDEFNKGNEKFIAKNRFDWEWSKFKRWRRQRRNEEGSKDYYLVKYRPQGGMTRDPYTSFFGACVDLNVLFLIRGIRIPLRCFRPAFSFWVIYLKTGYCEGLYRLFENCDTKLYKPEFAETLCEIRWEAYLKLSKERNLLKR